MKRRLLSAAIAGGIILAVAAVCFAEAGRRHLEASLTEFFRAPVHIERLRISPKQLTLQGVRISSEGGPASGGDSAQRPLVVVEELQIAGSLFGGLKSVQVTRLALLVGGVPLKAQGRLFLTKVPKSAVRCEGWLLFDHPLARGRMELSGTVLEPVVLGWLSPNGGQRRDFVSSWSLKRDSIRCKRMEIQGGWLFNGEISPEKGSAALDIVRGYDIIRLVTADWTVDRSLLQLTAILFGGQSRFSGTALLVKPYPVDLKLDLNGLALAELARWATPDPQTHQLDGTIHGTVKVRGPLARLKSEGELWSKAFYIKQNDFQSGVLRFKGQGPTLEIHNSQLVRPAGVMLVEGRFDLRRLGKPDFFSAVRLASLEKGISWDGWSVTPAGSSGLKMNRDVQMGMPLSGQQKVSIRLEDNEEFFGVEHRKRF